MENELYRSVIVPAAEGQDGETATLIHVCQEVNATVVWISSFEGGLEFLKAFPYNQHQAIEFAVDEARRRRAQIEKEKRS